MPVSAMTGPRLSALSETSISVPPAAPNRLPETPSTFTLPSLHSAMSAADEFETSTARPASVFNAEIASYSGDQWKKVKSIGEGDDCITLSRVTEPSSDLPISPVQAKTIVHAPLDKVLAVFMGGERNLEWSDQAKSKSYDSSTITAKTKA